MHLADAFIQSDFQYIQAIHLFSMLTHMSLFLLAFATNIPVLGLLMTGFVVQGHICAFMLFSYIKKGQKVKTHHWYCVKTHNNNTLI